jgi:glucose-1-phosphate thymidylyltransferase
MIQKRQGQQVACIEEVAYRMGYISQDALVALAQPYLKSDYGQYLLKVSKE